MKGQAECYTENNRNVLPRGCAINIAHKLIWNGKQLFRIIARILPVCVYNKQVFLNIRVRVAPLQRAREHEQRLLLAFSAAHTLGFAVDNSFCFKMFFFFHPLLMSCFSNQNLNIWIQSEKNSISQMREIPDPCMCHSAAGADDRGEKSATVARIWNAWHLGIHCLTKETKKKFQSVWNCIV